MDARTRIARTYRGLSPGRFHPINQRITKSLTDNEKIPDWVWGANPSLRQTYLTTSAKHDEVHHRALHGSKLDIAERDMLQAQLTQLLDEIALVLEAAAIRIPDILLHSGFDLAKERRSRHRNQAASSASEVATAEKQE